jgi:lipopolysaccharide transport system ATP-binding protein
MPPVIAVENLSKCYRLGTIGGATLREDFARWTAKLCRKPDPTLKIGQEHHSRLVGKEFWALDDVSFQVEEGEILGIIGRNGAGKSTLLKILSRVTAPSSGQVKIRGRVASLLEVGTGFHPELTGRENVFLNGAILGMTKAEIRQKFDEIVAFSEVEEFIDTPVKRYSSGMYVRLAFAVAAHLEPEILIVDEVLAVGDAQFQKKCLGKMQDVSRVGRTILFVSHNMDAILKLCSRTLMMQSGFVELSGATPKVVSAYLQDHASSNTLVELHSASRPLGRSGKVNLVSALPAHGGQGWILPFGKRLAFDVQVEASSAFGDIELGIGLFSTRGIEVASWTSRCSETILPLKHGPNTMRVEYPDLVLLPGHYHLGIGLRSDRGMEDYVLEAIRFEVVSSQDSADADAHTYEGFVVPKVEARVLT